MTTQKTNAEAKSAWLVTWEGTSSVPENPIAVILNSRKSARQVKDFVELLYVSLTYSPKEKLLIAKNAKANSYPATMTPFEQIHCGDNPFLHARLVSELKVVDDMLKWTEPPSATERQA